MITYICKYTPLELLAAMGVPLEEPNRDVDDFRHADSVIHSSVCSHAKILLEECMTGRADGHELILTSCCDTVRRVFDTVGANPEIRQRLSGLIMLDLPHENFGHAVDLYAGELARLVGFYEERGRTLDRQRLVELWKQQADNWAVFSEQGAFLAILGARVSNELRARIRNAMPFPVIDLSCGGLRSMPQPPERFLTRICNCTGAENGRSAELPLDDLLHAYAEALLNQLPCTRMEDVSRRSEILSMPNLKGIIYHSVKFCDYYSFEYAAIRRSSALPVLKIETDFTAQSEGQLDTRLMAFSESLTENGSRRSFGEEDGPVPSDVRRAAAPFPLRRLIRGLKGENSMKNEEKGASPRSAAPDDAAHAGAIYVGIDSGSTSTNVAAISENGTVLASCILRTGARAGTAAEKAYEDVRVQLGRNASKIRKVVATGYGRAFIGFADSTKTEISCHARGAHFADPSARCVIDIGGQDSKVICLDEDGNVMNFVMNDKCAAGTGRFLEMMAHTLETDLPHMSSLGLKWKKDLTISSTCTVFAESEVVSLIAENTDPADIVHALNKSVAGRTVGMVKRVRGDGPFMMSGGVARNAGVVKELENRLHAPVSVAEYPDLIGAIGAALFAREADH